MPAGNGLSNRLSKQLSSRVGPMDNMNTIERFCRDNERTQICICYSAAIVPSDHTQTAMHQPYVPISCAVHDELLALATLQRECELTIALSEGRTERIRGIIADVYTRDGAEYLQLRDGDTFRLDQIRALNGQPIPQT